MNRRLLILIAVVGNLLILTGCWFVIQAIDNRLLSVPITVRTDANPVTHYPLLIDIPARFLPLSPRGQLKKPHPHLFDSQGRTIPIEGYSFDNQQQLVHLTAPLTLSAHSSKRLFLEWTLHPNHASPLSQSSTVSLGKVRGTQGYHIEKWLVERMPAGDPIPDYDGGSMIRLTLIPQPVSGDHYTNEAITLPLNNPQRVTPDSFLMYALYFPQFTSFRVSLQGGFDDGTSTSFDQSTDQAGLSTHWQAPLIDKAAAKWYHRIIPLETHSGKTLTHLILFINDFPDISAQIAEQPVTVYFDAIHITHTLQPQLMLSNPLRELCREVRREPFFISLFCSLIWWILIALPLAKPRTR